jgi:hypothetical protein
LLPSRRAWSAIASFTVGADSTLSASMRRVDRSGPMTTSRRRRKWVRRTRESLRTVRSGGSASATMPRRETGGANCTRVSRPLSRSASRRRKRPTRAQFSENSTLNQPLLRLGACPTKIETGTSATSSAGSLRCASSSRASEPEWVLCSGPGTRPSTFSALPWRRESAT